MLQQPRGLAIEKAAPQKHRFLFAPALYAPVYSSPASPPILHATMYPTFALAFCLGHPFNWGNGNTTISIHATKSSMARQSPQLRCGWWVPSAFWTGHAPCAGFCSMCRSRQNPFWAHYVKSHVIWIHVLWGSWGTYGWLSRAALSARHPGFWCGWCLIFKWLPPPTQTINFLGGDFALSDPKIKNGSFWLVKIR